MLFDLFNIRVVGLCALMAVSNAISATEVVVRLSEDVTMLSVNRRDMPITIGDVAQINGGSAADRSRIQLLDLASFDRSSESVRITRREIELRLLIDRFERNDFRVVGPREVEVQLAQSDWLSGYLEKLFASEISRQFGLRSENVTVRLLDSDAVMLTEAQLDSKHLHATVLLPTQAPFGRSKIEAELKDRYGKTLLKEFDVNVIVSMEVALAKQRIRRGTVVTKDMFQTLTRPIRRRDDFAPPAEIAGNVAKTDIAPSQIILGNHLNLPRPNTGPVVRVNQLIDVIVNYGGNQVRLKNAKVMSSGKIGDSITVLNPRSRQRFAATVQDSSTAVVAPVRSAVGQVNEVARDARRGVVR